MSDSTGRYVLKSTTITPSSATIDLNTVFKSENKRIYMHSIGHHGLEVCILSNGVQISDYNLNATSMGMIKEYTTENGIDTSELHIDLLNIPTFNDNATLLKLTAQKEDTQLTARIKDFNTEIMCDANASVANASVQILINYVVDTKTVKKHKRKKSANTPTNATPIDMPVNKPTDEQTKIENEKTMALWCEKQVTLANRIFIEVKNSFKTKEFLELDDTTRLKYYQNKFSNFNRQHPLCIRYMVCMLSYSSTAFVKYIKKVSTSSAGDPDVYLQRQADYATLLWKENTPHWNQKNAKLVWEDAYKMVKAESDAFKKHQDSAELIAEKITSKYAQEQKEELAECIEHIKADNKTIDEVIVKSTYELNIEDYYNKLKEDPNYVSSDEEEPVIETSDEKWTFFDDSSMNETMLDIVDK